MKNNFPAFSFGASNTKFHPHPPSIVRRHQNMVSVACRISESVMNRRSFLAGFGLVPAAIVSTPPRFHSGGIVSASEVPRIMPPCETVIEVRGADMSQLARLAHEVERTVYAKMVARDVRKIRT